MYIIFSVVTFLILKSSHSVNFYAGITFNPSDLPPDIPVLGKFYDKLYFFYSNTLVDNGEKKLDDTYRQLDNIASGLSIFTDPVLEKHKLPSGTKNKHLLGSLESWCYTLTLFVFYTKLSNTMYGDQDVFPYLFNRCMNLNYNLTNYKVDMNFVDVLINSDTRLDDVYLFEKFSRMCPRPCYVFKDRLPTCNKNPNLKDVDLVNDFISRPMCYFNNFLDRYCESYTQLMRKRVSSFKSVFNTDLNMYLFRDRWAYMYMPKRVELELGMENLSYLLFTKIVTNCETRNCKEIRELISSIALKNLSIKNVMGQVDMTEKDPTKRLKLSFVVTFQVDQFRAVLVNRVFDFLIENVDLSNYHEVLLGRNALGEEEEEENKEEEKDETSTLRERYEKFREKRAKQPREVTGMKPETPELWQNKFQFINMSGHGQHRKVTMVFTLNQAVFKAFTPTNSKYYLKMTHFLDTSVYIDNDELSGTFQILHDQSQMYDLEPNPVYEEDGVARVEMKALLTPFVDVEQPEMNSSPVVYHGYVVLHESVQNYRSVVITCTLTLHTRYMHMHKITTKELAKVDNLRLLRSRVSREYSMALIAQPHLFMFHPKPTFNTVPLRFSYLRYLRFLKELSFGYFATPGRGLTGTIDLEGPINKWVPVMLTECNNFNLSIKLCQGYRTGLAISTRVINTYFCNPIVREMGGDVVEGSCYMAFSVPVGNQNDYPFVRNVTFTTLIAACLVSLFMVARYFKEMLPRLRRETKAD